MSLSTALCDDVLERIFDRLEGCDIARLNGTGSICMQKAVARCAKSVRFNMPHFARFPSLAISLPNIRALKVETISAHGAYPLNNLPSALPASWSNLTRLRLNYRQSFSALPLLRHLSTLTHLSCKGSVTPLAEGWEAHLPPNLTTLKLFTFDRTPVFTACEHLPPYIRCLITDAFSLRLQSVNNKPLQWPPMLERLSLYEQHSEHERLDSLPPLLTRFDFTADLGSKLSIIHASLLPMSLRRLNCPNSDLLMDISSLPPNLQVCFTDSIKLVDIVTMAPLPKSLQKIDTRTRIIPSPKMQTSYVDLPNLTTYRFTASGANDATAIDLSCCKFKTLFVYARSSKFKFWRFKLPSTVRTLYIDSLSVNDSIATLDLPRGLTHLNLTLVSEITLEAWQALPATIVRLEFATSCSTATAVQLLSNLPPRTEYLYVGYFDSLNNKDDTFLHMPSTLKSLSLDFAVKTSLTRGSWFHSIATRYNLTSLSIRMRRFDPSDMSDASDMLDALSILPATLRSLQIMDYHATLSTDCFKRLPRQLTELEFDISHVVGDATDFASLPPSLESIRLKQSSDATMSIENVIDFMPPGIIDFNIGHSPKRALIAALNRYYDRAPWQAS